MACADFDEENMTCEWFEMANYFGNTRCDYHENKHKIESLRTENERLEGVFAGLKGKAGAIAELRDRAESRVAELEAKLRAADRLADSCSSRFSLSLGATILAFSRSALDDYSKARASAAAKAKGEG